MSDYHQPSTAVRRLPSEIGLLLLDTASNRLLAYNHSARHLWDLVERGQPGHKIAADLAVRYGIPDDVARNDVDAMLDAWRSHGLLVTDGPGAPPIRQGTTKDATDWAHAPQPRWAATAICTVRDKVFSLAVEPDRSVAYVRLFLQHLQTPNAQPDFRLEIRETASGERALLVDGIERLRARDEGLLVGAVNQTILEHNHSGVEWLAMIHGGAVARNGAGLAIAAASGSGKTTLIAYLHAHEGFTYLADDLIALAAPEGRIVPWPMPLSIKEGSWNLLAGSYADLSRAPRYRTPRGEARLLIPDRSAWDVDPVPVHGIVFPRYVDGAGATLTRIAPFDAIQRLLGDRVWLGYPMMEARVRAFLAWLDRTPAYTLVHGNVVDAARCLRDIV